MRILVTAGNTQAPIDKVRCITNIFTGRTGAAIALQAQERGHAVTLLTSHPETVGRSLPNRPDCRTFRTFDELQTLLADLVPKGGFEAVVHSAAVSDYLAAGVFSPSEHTHFRADGSWISAGAAPPMLTDRAAGKIKSDEPELWIRLVRAPKLIDRMRGDWNFRGILVKFKLEVGVTEEQLQESAEQSRRCSETDLMTANTLEGKDAWAILGPVNGRYVRVTRTELASRLLDEIERLHKERRRG
jgi:phosphopantothenoylcysteine synthetase/decarboxylase